MQSLALKVKRANSSEYELFVSFKGSNVLNDRVSVFLNSVYNFTLLFKKPRGESWLIAVHDPYLFATALVTCWNRGIIPVVSADLQPGSLDELLKNADGVIFDIPDDLFNNYNAVNITVIAETQTLLLTSPGNKLNNIKSLADSCRYNGDAEAVRFFTSGSTGKRKQITKTFSSLFEEVDALNFQFGDQIKNMTKLSMVSHFHIYGFLFGLFWPLCTDLNFATRRVLYWEELIPLVPQEGAAIISSPATLKFLPFFIKNYSINKMIIFSSGGALDPAVVHEIEAFGVNPPIEILGSTETGGIAFRTQSIKSDGRFIPLNNVSVRVDKESRLMVKSLWGSDINSYALTGDIARIDKKGTFELLGRFDNIVKIAGKRVSLKEIEELILKDYAIIKVKIFMREKTEKNREALAVAACVIPDEMAKINTEPEYKKITVNRLKTVLKKRFAPVTIPRFWRFVDDFPVDSQGKTSIAMLEILFTDKQHII